MVQPQKFCPLVLQDCETGSQRVCSEAESQKKARPPTSVMTARILSSSTRQAPLARLSVLVCAVALLSACTALPEDQKTAENDPYENANRTVFAFNMAVDDYVLEPVSDAYRQTAPERVQKGVQNYVSWTGLPATAVNSGLQGKFENAALASLTFFVNGLTFGFADLMEGEDRPEQEDFGQTLASAGVSEGPYLMVPFLGSHTERSLSGRAVDMVLNPLGAFDAEAVETAQTATPVVSAVSFRAAFFETINDMKYNSLDPYARTRSAYYQQRARLLRDNLPEQDDELDEFEDFFSE